MTGQKGNPTRAYPYTVGENPAKQYSRGKLNPRWEKRMERAAMQGPDRKAKDSTGPQGPSPEDLRRGGLFDGLVGAFLRKARAKLFGDLRAMVLQKKEIQRARRTGEDKGGWL